MDSLIRDLIGDEEVIEIDSIDLFDRAGPGKKVPPRSEYFWEYAYEVWAYACSRDYAKTYENLVTSPLGMRRTLGIDGDENPLSVKELRKWGDTHGWKPRADIELATLIPGLRQAALRELGLAVVPSILALRKVIDGNDRREAPQVANTIRAATAVLDRMGLSPRSNTGHAVETSVRGKVPSLDEVMEKTEDELIMLEAELMSD